LFFFFTNATSPTEIYTLSLHDALPIYETVPCSLMDFLAVRLTMSRVASRMGAAQAVPQEDPLKTEERRRLSRAARIYDAARVVRSEEHTSELQSRFDLVCRLLLEKKKK